MEIKNYRSFIRERKIEVNKLTGVSIDSTFEKKVNYLLEGKITNLEFQTYLENDLYLNINESYLINESLASKFVDNVKSKIKSLFNNLYQKLKETSGFQMIITFFEKVVSGLSKFWKFLKKIKAGKILKKLAITLGITSLASYILAQFGAGWVALMGGRMAANIVGKKIGDKVVKESFHLKLFEDFLKSKDYKNIHDQNIDKLNDFYNKNYKVIDSYYDFIFKNIGNSKPSINGSSEATLRGGGGDALPWVNKDPFFRGTSKLSDLYKEFNQKLKQLKTHIKNYKTSGFFEFINWISNHSILKKKEVESNVKFLSETWKNINKNEKSIIDEFESLVGFKFQASNTTNTNNKNNPILDKTDKKETSDKTDKKETSDKTDKKETSDKTDKKIEDSKEDSKEDVESDDKSGDKKEGKKSIWSKIGGAISKFFKIFRKLKWAIVIFFGVVFILNLIFYPIFEPILQVAQVSSFSMILSDTFEETANAVSSIPKVNLDDVEINTDITDNLPSDSEVTKNIQGAIDGVKENIEGNEELAAEEADDIVQKSFMETKSEPMNLSEIEKDMDPSKGQAQVQAQVQAQGPAPEQEVEKKGGFFKNLKDKAKEVLNITDGDKFVKGLEKSGYQFQNSKIPIKMEMDRGVEFEISDTDWTGGKSEASAMAFREKFIKSDEWNNLPSDVKKKMSSNLSKYVIYKEVGDKYVYNVLIPKTDIDVSGLSGDELVEQLGSQIKEIGKSISESGYDNSPGNGPIELSIANSLKNGQLSPDDLEKLKNINTDDFYNSVSKIKQNGFVALKNKLTEQGIKPNSEYMVFKELDNGNIQWFYLIPKKSIDL